MAEKDGYIPGVPCWVDTSQPDPQAAAVFYGGLFGWEFEDLGEAPGQYAAARLRGREVAAIAPAREGAPASWNTYVWVSDAEQAAGRALAAGGRVLMEPFEVSDAGRMAMLADPEGAVLFVWQANRHRGAQIVNEAGSLTFNTLRTRDPAAAEAFYGELFGWRTMPMPGGAEWAWTLAGYGDHLERDRPNLRAEMAAMGAPAGFEDVVAAMTRCDEKQQSGWEVTFAVNEADATAARAAELGGSVLVAPLDAPWVRSTVIADPAGATFTASQFKPENRDLSA